MQSSNDFKSAEDEYFRLKGQLAAGRITAEQFNASLKDLMIDYEGRYWMLGAKTGKWYVHDGQNWVETDPPIEASPEAPGTGKPLPKETSPRRADAPPVPSAAVRPPTTSPTPTPQMAQREITTSQFEAVARALQSVREQKLLSEQEFKALHATLRGKGPSDTVWTVALRSQQWHKLNQGRWVPAVPPAELSIAADVLTAIQQRVPEKSLAALLSEPVVERQGIACARCGATNKVGKKFCTSCAAPIVASPPPVALAERGGSGVPAVVDEPFLMPVEDFFSITGRGTVTTGQIERGVIRVGDEVQLVGSGAEKRTVVTGVEMFRKLVDVGRAGDKVGLLLRGIGKDEIKRGMMLATPGSIIPPFKGRTV